MIYKFRNFPEKNSPLLDNMLNDRIFSTVVMESDISSKKPQGVSPKEGARAPCSLIHLASPKRGKKKYGKADDRGLQKVRSSKAEEILTADLESWGNFSGNGIPTKR
ncbi:hypothetical protein JTB14_012110 [Gonioctena quinquepunctata]|nr:hypothetical protein JTB14_012110 [Gonioctena quinquepunctata]